jgi:putative ABC transport system substrate-binding protein
MAATRRLFLQVLAATPLALAGAARSQAPKVVGVLGNYAPLADLELGAASPYTGAAAFVRLLRDRGWRAGRNLRIAWRSAEGYLERLPALASELVRMPVDVIVASDYGAVAALRATSTIPVVALSIASPVERGYALSLARPGRNLTGITINTGAETQKSVGWLKEAVPGLRNLAFVTWDLPEKADNHPGLGTRSPIRAAAQAMGVQVAFMTFGHTDTLPELVRSAVRQGTEAFLFDQQYSIHYYRDVRERLAAELIRVRKPALHLSLTAAADGALMSHGDDHEARWRKGAHLVHSILRGEKPGDIPIEQPGKPELHVNLKAARAIGLTLPASLLLQADRVFE